METVAFVLLLISNAAALLYAARYRRKAERVAAIAYALSPEDGMVTLWPCDCGHLLLHAGRNRKVCCDTEHSGAICQPVEETI